MSLRTHLTSPSQSTCTLPSRSDVAASWPTLRTENLIEEHRMVLKATQHLGKDPSHPKKTVKFCDLNKTEQIWNKCKAFYSNALHAIKRENKCFGVDLDCWNPKQWLHQIWALAQSSPF